MKDEHKSRDQLLVETAALRARLASLEQGTSATPAPPAAAHGPVPAAEADAGTGQALLRCSPAAIVAVDRAGRVVLWSPAAEQMFGWREKEVLGQANPIVPADAPDELGRLLAAAESNDGGAGNVDAPCACVRRDGSLIETRISAALLHDHRGRMIGAIGVLMAGDEPLPEAVANARDEQELGHLFNAVHEGVWIVDARGVTTFVNQVMAKMLGYGRAEMVGRSALDFVPEPARHQAIEILRRRERGEADGHEVWLPRKGGGGVWCYVSGAPLYDADGAYAGAVATVKDVTPLKEMERVLEQRVQERTAELTEANRRLQEQIDGREHAERALRDSEERFRLLAENASDLICRHAPDGRYVYVSPSCRKLLGYEPHEMLGRSPYDFFHPDDIVQIRTVHDRVLQWPEATTIEYRLRRRDGSHLWVETVTKAVRDRETGAVRELHTSTRDITSRRDAEQQLRLIQCAVEQIDEMVIITDAELDPPGPRIEYVNPAFTRVTGYTLEDLRGRTPRALQGPRTSREVLDRLRRQLSQGERFEGETYNYRRDGSEFILHWHIAPLRDHHGNITHYVSIQRDVTEQRREELLMHQRETELAHAGRLSTMGEMASGLAHELNQPLAAIAIYVQGCLRRVRAGEMSPEDLEDALESVRDQAQRASEIIRRLRDFVRKREPQRTAADANHLVREVLALIDADIQRHSIQLRLELDEELPRVLVDPVQIEQVILNLVRNAIEAMQDKPVGDRPLTIRTTRDGAGGARISVRDAGVGMTDAQFDRIFEPFFTTKGTGMGMGLNISQSIARANEGRLFAERNADRGMTFHLTVPLAKPGG